MGFQYKNIGYTLKDVVLVKSKTTHFLQVEPMVK